MNHAAAFTLTPAARALVNQALADQRALGETVERLLGAINDRQTQLGRQLAAVLDLLAEGPVVDFSGDPADADRALPELAPVRVRCLGEFSLLARGKRVDGWRSGRARALFQYLVNHHDRPITRDSLISALWPDPDASTPGTSLKVAVHTLRHSLAQAGVGQELLSISANEAGYQLSTSGLWLDVEEFELFFAQARRLDLRGRRAEALDLYARAADLYRGDFLEESWEDWVVFRREGLKDRYLFVLAHLADAALAAGDYHGCILRCQQLLEKDRCREDSYRTLMLCHAHLGQRGRVRCWYDLCVRTLKAELDVGPERETEEVYRRALSGQL